MTLHRSVRIQGKPRRPMSRATRDKRERFHSGDLILSYGQPFECFGVVALPSGRVSQRYRLFARCDDCRRQFWQVALRSDIKADRLRRRCDDCKEPMRVTKPVARYASERRLRSATEKATKLLDARHLARLVQAALAAGGEPLAMSFAAEAKGIRSLRRAHLKSAYLASIPISEIIALEIGRRLRLVARWEVGR